MIFNYNSFAKNLKRCSKNSVHYCHEEEYSKYIDLNYALILIGNLDIVSKPDLHYNMKFGTKYRLKRHIVQNIVIKLFIKN